jgi:hypothetical protein
MSTKTFSGSRASLKLNGVKVAFVSGINVTQDNHLVPIEVLDQLEVAEFAECGFSCNFSARFFKVDENAALALGLEFANLDDVLTQPELVMEVYDRVGDKVIYTMSGVKLASGEGSIDARGVWTGSWNFSGRVAKGI